MSVRLNTREVGLSTVVDVSGRIALEEGARVIRDCLRGLVIAGKKQILLNLSDVRDIDSSGIAELMSGFAMVESAGGSLKLLGLSKRLKEKVLAAQAEHG